MAGTSSRGLSGHLAKLRLRDAALAGAEVALVLVLLGELAALIGRFVGPGHSIGMDSGYFYQVASRVVSGEIPYRDFPLEYPPLAILPILLPRLVQVVVGGHAARYALLLVAENVCFVAATAGCLVLLARRGWSAVSMRRTVVGYLVLAVATPVLFWRFDAFPTLLMMLGLVGFAWGRRGPSGLALGAGIAAKLFPVAVAALLVAADLFRREWAKAIRLVTGATLAVAIVGAIVFIVAGTGGLSFLYYQADRGVQLESLLASIAMIGQLFGAPAGTVFNAFGAFQIDSPVLASVPWLGGAIAVVLVGALVVSTAVRFRADVHTNGDVLPATLVTQLLATLLAVLLVYRVLSPQFLVWLLPLAALRPRREFMLIFLICVLTFAIYPLTYPALVGLEPSVVVGLIFRNLLLTAMFVWLIGREALATLSNYVKGRR